MTELLEKLDTILEYFQAWFKILAERFTWVLDWKDKTESTISAIMETESETNA
jgi:hypothetical protein